MDSVLKDKLLAAARAAMENAARSAEAEAARLAQEQYARELEEYELKKAQYERDMAEYERQKAAYDAQMAAQEAAETTSVKARRRRPSAAYSDYVPEEDVSELPDAPAWPQMEQAAPVMQAEMDAEKKPGFLDRVARIMDTPEDEEIAGIRTLPPRVDMHDAYQPAKTPDRGGRRRR